MRVECQLMNIHHICVLGVCFHLARCSVFKKMYVILLIISP